MQWNTQQWYAGQDVYLIGGGKSLGAFDWKRLHNKLAVGCNDAYRLGPSVCNVCVFGDDKWYKKNEEGLKTFPNPIFTNHRIYQLHKKVLWLERVDHGLSRTQLGFGGSTGCIALNLALILGARRVFLLGFDMKIDETGQANWHQFNIGKPNKNSYERFSKGFARMAIDLPTVFSGREVINLGPDSKLDVFPMNNMDKFI